MREIIAENAAPQPLADWLRAAFPFARRDVLARALKQRDVRINGVRAAADASVSAGSLVRVYIDEALLALPEPIIVYRDHHVLIADKPDHMSTADDAGSLEALLRLRAERDGGPIPRAVHRLDARTGGVAAFALSDAVEEALTAAFRARRVRKEYRCIVRGHPGAQGRDTAYMIKDARRALVLVSARERPGSLPITTAWRTLATGSAPDGTPVSLLSVLPETGRTHQIRAHMAYLHAPLIGDDKYGDRPLNRACSADGQALWAVSLSFSISEGACSYLDGKVFSTQGIGWRSLAARCGLPDPMTGL